MKKYLLFVLIMFAFLFLGQMASALAADQGTAISVYPPFSPTEDGRPQVAAHYLDVAEDGQIRLALQLLAPGANIEAVRIDNVGGQSALWRSDFVDSEAWPITVTNRGQTLTTGSAKMKLGPLGENEEILELSLLDNGAFNERQTDFRVTVFMSGDARALYLLKPPLKFFKINTNIHPLEKDQYPLNWLDRMRAKFGRGDLPPQEKDQYTPYNGWWDGCYVKDTPDINKKFLADATDNLCKQDDSKSDITLVKVNAYLSAEETGQYVFSVSSQVGGQAWWAKLTKNTEDTIPRLPKAIYVENTKIATGTDDVLLGGAELSPGLYSVDFVFLTVDSSDPLHTIELMIKRPSDVQALPISDVLLGKIERPKEQNEPGLASKFKAYIVETVK